MVCLGNICRSPLAEGILKHKLRQSNKEAVVASAGFESFHAGDRADDRAVAVAKKYGIDITKHRARVFRQSDFDNFDRIYVMDDRNYRDVIRLARNESDRQKVNLIMDVTATHAGQIVPDPYYGGEADYELAYRLLNSACETIAKTL